MKPNLEELVLSFWFVLFQSLSKSLKYINWCKGYCLFWYQDISRWNWSHISEPGLLYRDITSYAEICYLSCSFQFDLAVAPFLLFRVRKLSNCTSAEPSSSPLHSHNIFYGLTCVSASPTEVTYPSLVSFIAVYLLMLKSVI